MNLENPKKLRPIVEQARLVAENVFRPISRKYDTAEHAYPKELDMLAALLDGMNEGGARASASHLSQDDGSSSPEASGTTRNGGNLTGVLGTMELCWGDVGLLLTIPRQGLGNAAVSAVGTPEQKEKFKKSWVAMAITEPGAGSDSAAIRTSARLDGDEWVLRGEKIFVTAGERADAVVVWATLDPALGRAAIKSFLVPKGTPGMRVVRLDKKLGIRASDTATIELDDCRIPKENILGSPEIDTKKSFAGVMKTFDNTRPVVAAMAVGVARAALDRARELLKRAGVLTREERTFTRAPAAESELHRLEAELEAARLLTMKAAWMADNGIPNSLEASMAKAKAARVANETTLKCVELCGTVGYAEQELLEKWARDSKILDIFEGTQQIQMLIIARRLLGKSSTELR
ncbi:acyl-CoA dehydrogenase family protein [Pendulispora albinea]|uniref:Acyl-CoA dehydrogenase family protein n=1 Tax=Pendulispora albinea TaxID=2741071 RepID=A0ABZ2LSG9_9BACT